MADTTNTRDCPDCEQGKHQTCLVEVLDENYINGDEEWWNPCRCLERGHVKKEDVVSQESIGAYLKDHNERRRRVIPRNPATADIQAYLNREI